ncbi:hypothetical protein BH10CYA1_BH10CYA1_39690 [soil metagenome]
MQGIQPLVSVITSVFNKERFVVDSINSALNQTYINLEVIVVDDASTDSSFEQVCSLKDPRVKVHRIEHGGPSVCKNYGYGKSSGAFVAFLDADDLWESNKLATHVEALNDNPEAGLCFSLTQIIDEHGNQLFCEAPYVLPSNWYQAMLQRNYLISGSNAVHRRELLQTIGAFDDTLRASADWDLYIRFAREVPLILVPHALVQYRHTQQQYSLDVLAIEQSAMTIIEREYSSTAAQSFSQNDRKSSVSNLYKYLRGQCHRNTTNPNLEKNRAIESAQVLLRSLSYSNTQTQIHDFKLAMRMLSNGVINGDPND